MTTPVFRENAVRDALGLVRLLWAMEMDVEPDLARSSALQDIGEILRDTLRQGRLDRESLGYRAAIGRSEEAVDRLAALGWSGPVLDLVLMARSRVRGGAEPAKPTEREEQKRGAYR